METDHLARPRPTMDHIAAAAVESLDVPAALLTVAEDGSERVAGARGLEELTGEIRGDPPGAPTPFDRQVIRSGAPLAVEDARAPEGPESASRTRIGAYLGVPLGGQGGAARGALSALQTRPAKWSHRQVTILEGLAVAGTRELDLRAALGRVRAEAEREDRYRLLVHATNNAVRDHDLASGRVTWDGAYERVLRYTPREIGSRIEWWYERIHPEDRERVVRGLEEVVNGAEVSWSAEYRFRRGDGTFGVVLDRCYVQRNERAVPIRVVGGMVDVTERKRTEETQRFLARASSVLDRSLDEAAVVERLVRLAVPDLADCCSVDLVGEDGHVRRSGAAHVDPAQERSLSVPVAQGRVDSRSRHPVLRVIRTGESMLGPSTNGGREDLFSPSRSGEHGEHEDPAKARAFMVVPLRARSQVLGALTLASTDPARRYRPADLMTGEDLGRRAALALDNARLYERARRATDARDEVLRVVAHDLKNPLNTIQLAASLLLETEKERRSGTLERLELIRQVALETGDLIEDLLDTSAIEAGRFSVEGAARSVAALLEEARRLLQPLARPKRIRLVWNVEEALPRVRADSRQLLRVFSNLVGNAIDFTPEEGRIEVRAEREEDRVRFSIRDSGPGIPEDQLPHVFDRFWQGRSGDRRGSGLGLTIARGLVEAHGGAIGVDSAEGEGATFHFTIPVVAEAEPWGDAAEHAAEAREAANR